MPRRPPRVSIVMPLYNAAPFVTEAITSILTQSFGDWELLIVDDGSTDGSDELARRAATACAARIRLLCHPGRVNRGTAIARNVGLAHARAELVTWLDADDVYTADSLAERVAVLDHYSDAAMVYGNAERWYSWSTNVAVADYVPDFRLRGTTTFEPPALAIAWLRRRALTPCTGSAIARRRAIEHVGGSYERASLPFEDQVLFYKLALVGVAVACDTVWSRYRKHPASVCHTARSPRTLQEEFHAWLEDHAKTIGTWTPEIAQALAWARWRHAYPSFVQMADRVTRRWRRVASIGTNIFAR